MPSCDRGPLRLTPPQRPPSERDHDGGNGKERPAHGRQDQPAACGGGEAPANPPTDGGRGGGVLRLDPALEGGQRPRTYPGIRDSSAAIERKQRSAHLALEQARISKKSAAEERPDKFRVGEYRAALLNRRQSRLAGEKPTVPLHQPMQLRGADENPNLEPEMNVDSRGAFFDPKLHALVNARLLGTRSSSAAQYAQVLACCLLGVPALALSSK